MIKLKSLLTETTVRLSTMKDASFEPGEFVQILGKKGKVKLDKKSVKYLAKWIRNNSGKHGMGWSFTEGKLNEAKTLTLPNGVKAIIDFKGIKFKARKSFRARHNCDNPGPRNKARYWSCRKW